MTALARVCQEEIAAIPVIYTRGRRHARLAPERPAATLPAVRETVLRSTHRTAAVRRLGLGLVAAALAACGSESTAELSELAQKGERIYLNVCIACHNANPALDGAVGPANAGASLELLEAKLLRGEYPPGYTPKRAGGAMPRFEYLKDDIPALHAYLNEVPY